MKINKKTLLRRWKKLRDGKSVLSFKDWMNSHHGEALVKQLLSENDDVDFTDAALKVVGVHL